MSTEATTRKGKPRHWETQLERMKKPPSPQTSYVKVTLPLPDAYEALGCPWFPFAVVERLQGSAGPSFFYWDLAKTKLTLLYRAEVAPTVAEGKELSWLMEVARGRS